MILRDLIVPAANWPPSKKRATYVRERGRREDVSLQHPGG
jgi:hypothetical protein